MSFNTIFMIILAVVGLACLLLYQWLMKGQADAKAKMQEAIKEFPLTKTKELEYDIIGFHEDEKYFVHVVGQAPANKIPFNKIISSEVVTDGETISKSSIKGAVIGGVVAGGIGALIGSGINTKTKEKIKTIDIKLTIDCLTNPVVSIRFYTNGGDDGVYALKNALIPLEEWEGIFKVIIERNQRPVAQ
jgi:hypothetical protein